MEVNTGAIFGNSLMAAVKGGFHQFNEKIAQENFSDIRS